MKTIDNYLLLMGVNDASHFLHIAQERQADTISMRDFFAETEKKRFGSLINPGILMSIAYSYFVFGYELRCLDDFFPSRFLNDIKIQNIEDKNFYTKQDQDKWKYLQRRLRNSIAHCRFKVEVRSKPGKIQEDGDVWYVFSDENNGKDKIEFAMSFPTFGNIINLAGAHCANKIRTMRSIT
ncbi:MAG: HEPN family nuclease [Candidatus Competibacteraceae bacterium]